MEIDKHTPVSPTSSFYLSYMSQTKGRNNNKPYYLGHIYVCSTVTEVDNANIRNTRYYYQLFVNYQIKQVK